MQLSLLTTVALAFGAQAAIQGFDISSDETTVDFSGAYTSGARFAFVKATEGTTYIDPLFASHYAGATDAGLLRGAYHVAHLGETSGASQADYFVSHGGGWTVDGITLPGMVELAPSATAECWGMPVNTLTSWIHEFSSRYHIKTGRYPLIYTTASWWSDCTGNSLSFAATNPLVLADYGATISTIPGGWTSQTIWQDNTTYPYGGNSDIFNGSYDQLLELCNG